VQVTWIGTHLDELRPVGTGDAAPAFALHEIGPDGVSKPDRVDLAQLRAQVIVVDFWAIWCKPCLTAMPALEQFAHRPGVRVLALGPRPWPSWAAPRAAS